MGMFNFVNFNKEGPGVSKNEKKKKGFFRFFEIYFANFWTLVTQGLINVVIGIPVITYFLGEIGLCHITRSISREKHTFGTSDFLDAIKKNWLQSLLIGFINVIVTVIVAYSTVAYFLSDSENNILVGVFLGVSVCFLFVFTVMKYYMPMMVITFSLKTKQIYSNAFKFVFLNLKKNLLIFFTLLMFWVVMAGAVLLSLYSTEYVFKIVTALVSVLIVCVYPGFRSYLIQYNIFDCIRKYMIDPYYEEHPDADIEKRLSLGLTVPEEYMPKYDDESIFDDESIISE